MKFPLAKEGKSLYNTILQMEYAGVMELVDVTDSKSVGLIPRVGSSPTTGTIKAKRYRCHWRKASDINRFRAFLQLKIHR